MADYLTELTQRLATVQLRAPALKAMKMNWSAFVADAAKLTLPDKSADLVIGSPPYGDARTYGINAQRDCQRWIDWMLTVTAEACRVSRGLVLWVAAGVTREWNYWPMCEGLMYEWWTRGGGIWRPCYWHRVGIPGSGGKQWLRADVEYVMAFQEKPGKIMWANNTANGHPPKWAPGGEMSYRAVKGARKNQVYRPPAVANPGNLIQGIRVGGGVMGHPIAHENEAPYPVDLPRWFIRSHCPPGGTVYDPFCGSGTTLHAAWLEGRDSIGSDIRQSEINRTIRRMNDVIAHQ